MAVPRGQPGRPISAFQLADRLRQLGLNSALDAHLAELRDGVTIQVYRPTGRPQYATAAADLKHVA